MGVTINSAYLGDERSRVNVTSALQEKVSSDGSISVPVNSGLLPYITFNKKIELTKDEEQEAYKKAVNACGNEANKNCMQAKTEEFKRERLEEKEQEQQANAGLIKGRRLTVTLTENGEKKVIEVPEGSTFEYGKATPPSFEPRKSWFPSFSISDVTIGLVKYSSIIVGSVLYVVSVFITFVSFKSEGFGYWTYIITALAAVIPYSGFLIVFVFFAMRTWIQNMPIPK